MDLLAKFGTVEVKADHRIAETDRFFCEQHQAAYEAAILTYQELSYIWAEMEKQQQDLLGDKDGRFYHNYLTSHNGPHISERQITDHVEHLHKDFIDVLTDHFCRTYAVTVSKEAVEEALLPEKPQTSARVDFKAWETYHETMQNLTIRYEAVVDQVILRLDGRSFAEQAFYELREKCHKAAWNHYQNKPEFERKKDVIRFYDRFCIFKTWPYDNEFEISDGMKSILYAAAHFESGSCSVLPPGFSELLGYRYQKTDTHDFTGCEKIKRMKMFKNGRVDLRFASAEDAETFVKTYLGEVL